MPFCIKSHEYNPEIHDIISGPHQGPCGPSCSLDSSKLTQNISLFFNPNSPVVLYYGESGTSLVVPQGFDYAVYVDSSGMIFDEPVIQGQSILFKSDIFLGSGVMGSAVEGLKNTLVDLSTPCPEGKSKGFGYSNSGWGIVDCGCYQSASGPILAAFGGAALVRGMIKKHFKKRIIKELIDQLNFQELSRNLINEVRNYISNLNNEIANLRSELFGSLTIEQYNLEISNLDRIKDLLGQKIQILINWASPLENDELKNYTELVDIENLLNIGYENIDEAISQVNSLEGFVNRWLNLTTHGPATQAITQLTDRLNALRSISDSIKSTVSSAIVTLALIDNVDLVMDKICDSGLLPSICGEQAQIDFLTCKCDQCPPFNIICSAGLAANNDDRFNTCIPSCEGGSVLEQSITGACSCVCPEGTEFKECDSGYNPEASCGEKGGEGLCISSFDYESRIRNNWTWSEEECDFVCDRSCEQGRVPHVISDLCTCACGSIDNGTFIPNNCPDSQLQDSDCECCDEKDYNFQQKKCNPPSSSSSSGSSSSSSSTTTTTTTTTTTSEPTDTSGSSSSTECYDEMFSWFCDRSFWVLNGRSGQCPNSNPPYPDHQCELDGDTATTLTSCCP